MSKLYYSPKNSILPLEESPSKKRPSMKDYMKIPSTKTSSRNYSHPGLYGEVNQNILRKLKEKEKEEEELENSPSER